MKNGIKKLLVIALSIAAVGCSSNPPKTLQPEGELKPVNPIEFNIEDLKVS